MEKKIESRLLKEEVFHYQLKNGLNVYILPKKGYSKQFAIYAARYGSNDSEFIVPGEEKPITVPDGIAHFLEHKLFEEEKGNVFEDFSRLGAQPNAFTNFTTTAYHFTSTGNFYESLDTLVGFVGRPYFTDENVEKEKGIIAQEIRMYQDNAHWKVFFNMLNGLYQDYPVKKDIAGTVESIQEINKDILYKCYETFYHPSNMVLFIIGDIDKKEAFDVIQKQFEKNTRKRQEEIKRIYPTEPERVNKRVVEEKLAVHRPLFALGFKDTNNGKSGFELLKKTITYKTLLELLIGPSSDLFSQLYESGLIDDSFQADYTGEIDYGYAILGGESSHPEKVVEAVEKEIIKRRREYWDKEDFLRIARKKIGEYIRGFNYLESTGHQFTSMILKDIQIFDYLEAIEQIDFSHSEKQFKEFFDMDRSSLSLIQPKTKKAGHK